MDPVGISNTQRSYTDIGISAEQIDQLKSFIQDTEVSYVNDDGVTVTTNAAALLDEPRLDADQALALLQAISSKLRGENIESATEAVQANKEKQEKLHQERMEKLMEAIEAAKDAKKSGEIGQAFAWIGVAVAIIAAVAATALTFGAGAAVSALMVAGCIAAIAGAVVATTLQVVSSIPGALESMGAEGQKAFMFTMMALQIACAIASLGVGAASSINAAKATADIAQQATKVMTVASYVSKGAQITGGVTEVAGGAANIASAERQHEADMIQADMQEIAKFIKMLQQSDEKEIEFIKVLQEMTDKAWQIVSGASKEAIDARHTVVQFTPA